MARIRSIKPDYFRSPKVRSLPYEARWMFVGMWTECDDEGRMPCTARMFAGLFFGDDRKASDRKIEGWIKLLAQKELIVLYEVAGTRYAAVTNWREHQKINKPQPAKYPAPPPETLFDPDSGNVSGSHSGNGSGTDSSRGKEGIGKDLDLGGVANEPESVSNVPPYDAATRPEISHLNPRQKQAVEALEHRGKTLAGALEMVEKIGADAVLTKLSEAS